MQGVQESTGETGSEKEVMKPITHDEEILVRRLAAKLYELRVITGKEFCKLCKRAMRRPKKAT